MKIPGIINSYCGEFFKEFKYISDSRMNWREDVEKIVQLENDRALHLLTHPIWYSNEERSMKRCLEDLIKNKTFRTYESLYDNFRDLDDVITKGEILCRLQNF